MVHSTKKLQNDVLPSVALEIERDRQREAERILKQRLLGVQMICDPAKPDRMNAGKRRQGFVPTRKFYRSRRK